MTDKIKVSVIVPIYNMEQYLRECIESIITQTLRDIEIICIDDGSNDNSLKILYDYQKKDGRVHIIHRDNSGYGKTVNIGIEQSNGEYIAIVEPDDYILPEMLETLYACVKNNGDLDFVNSDYQWFYKEGKEQIIRKCKVFDDKELYNRVLCTYENKEVVKGNFINPAGLYKRDFLYRYDIRHNETPGASFQDRGFCLLVLMYAEKFMVIPESYYCYRHDNPKSSITNSTNYALVFKEYKLLRRNVEKRCKENKVFWGAYFYKAYASYRYAFVRCVDSKKMECINMLSDEIRDWEGCRYVDLSLFSNVWLKEIAIIKDNAQDFLTEYFSLKEEVHELVNSYSSIIIYGAGVVGKRIYDEMCDADKKKVLGFAVTNRSENAKNYKDVPILQIDSFLKKREDVVVIVGVTEKYREEVMLILEQMKFVNIKVIKSLGGNI